MGVGQSTVVLNMLEGKGDIPKGLACETQPYQNADLAAVLAPPSPTVLEQRQSDDSQINKTLQTKSIIPLLHDCFRTHGNTPSAYLQLVREDRECEEHKVKRLEEFCSIRPRKRGVR